MELKNTSEPFSMLQNKLIFYGHKMGTALLK